MRNMSFALTTDQILNRTKTVTRRLGWWFVKPGETVHAVKKAMGLKKGEKVEILATIRIVSTRPEPMHAMTDDVNYGFDECVKEGFGDDPKLMWPSEFVRWFCEMHHIDDDRPVNRIEFEYVAEVPK